MGHFIGRVQVPAPARGPACQWQTLRLMVKVKVKWSARHALTACWMCWGRARLRLRLGRWLTVTVKLT
eukprot:1826364-Rhodomonas_salina.2